MNITDIENNFKEELKNNTTRLSLINLKKFFDYLDKNFKDNNREGGFSIYNDNFIYLLKIVNKGVLTIYFSEMTVKFSFSRKKEDVATVSGSFNAGSKIENCHQISMLFNLFND